MKKWFMGEDANLRRCKVFWNAPLNPERRHSCENTHMSFLLFSQGGGGGLIRVIFRAAPGDCECQGVCVGTGGTRGSDYIYYYCNTSSIQITITPLTHPSIHSYIHPNGIFPGKPPQLLAATHSFPVAHALLSHLHCFPRPLRR